MQIPITRTSRYAMEQILHAHSGTVHSVYRRTINLKLHPYDIGSDHDIIARDNTGPLIALQDRDCVLSPLSLCTSLSARQLSALPVREGQSVLVNKDSILIETPDNPIEFEIPDFAAAADLNPAAHPALPLAPEILAALNVSIHRALPLSPSNSLARIFCDEQQADDLILHSAQVCVSKAAALFHAGEAASSADVLCKGLIGLGPGLTPGGDDFLCGVLAGLFLQSAFLPAVPRTTGAEAVSAASSESISCNHQLNTFAYALASSIASHLSDTNDISAAFLRCACAGRFSEPVILLASIASERSSDSHIIADIFSKIGHTSGFDTLAGIYYALTLTPKVR